MAFPYMLAVNKDPSEADVALLDFLAKSETMQEFIVSAGWSSTLVGGKVHPLVEENNFKYKFVTIEKLRDKSVHERIINIVEQGGDLKKTGSEGDVGSTGSCCGGGCSGS